MGLCYSINREFYLLQRKSNDNKKRTFKGLTRLVRLVEIYDGDTFKIITRLCPQEPLFQYSLRLSGIDAPEIKPKANTPDLNIHKKAGIAVRDKLRQLYPIGTIFIVDFEEEDKYGRLLGTVWTVTKSPFGLGPARKYDNVCQLILNNGWAMPYNGGKKTNFSS